MLQYHLQQIVQNIARISWLSQQSMGNSNRSLTIFKNYYNHVTKRCYIDISVNTRKYIKSIEPTPKLL